MDLSSMIENSTKEETSETLSSISNMVSFTEDKKVDMSTPNIDHVKMIDEDEGIDEMEATAEENTVVEEVVVSSQTNHSPITPESLLVDVVDFKKHIGENIENLQYTKCLNITSNDISNEDGIIMLKSVEGDKNIIQLYKNMNNYNIFDGEIDYMKLFGENGFMIKYKSIGDYHWKLYGAKSSMCVALFINIGEKQYPLFVDKFAKTKFDRLEWPDDFTLMTIEEYTSFMNDNSSFNIENCCVFYHPLYKKMDELNTKKLVIDKLHDILVKTYDVAHCIKVINAMIKII